VGGSHVRIAIPCEVFTLDSGLRLIVHENHDAPLAAVNVWYHVGSRDEVHGRTGLAHLFEHLMFEGSANVPPGEFDRALEAVGGTNNGSTTTDRTNYWETVPSNALELALFLEADRMGGLLAALTHERFHAQRDVVMNERRESYENRPYGLAHEHILAALYPPDHPYHWPVIGFMQDIAAATFADAEAFFHDWYTPNNASIAVAGDVETGVVLDLVQRHFGAVPAGPIRTRSLPVPAQLPESARLLLEDAVQLPRLYITWHSPAAFAPGDAEMDALAQVFAAGKASRLYRSLVVDQELAVEVAAQQQSAQLGSTFLICVTAKPGIALAPIEEAVRAEIETLAKQGITEPEMERARNTITTAFVDDLQTVGGFGGRADRLNLYELHVGDPGFAQQDLERYLHLDAVRATEVARSILQQAYDVTLSVVPRGRTQLAASPS
jgi:zinc protease